MDLNKNFWDLRYQNNEIGWDIGYISTPLKKYIDQLTDKNIKILIPGGGNSYEAEYLHNLGFKNVFVVDISPTALTNLKNRVPDFPKNHLINIDFFKLNNSFDLANLLTSFVECINKSVFISSVEPSIFHASLYLLAVLITATKLVNSLSMG